jgi:hypothetical protein
LLAPLGLKRARGELAWGLWGTLLGVAALLILFVRLAKSPDALGERLKR